jgi:hypothetical protein
MDIGKAFYLFEQQQQGTSGRNAARLGNRLTSFVGRIQAGTIKSKHD